MSSCYQDSCVSASMNGSCMHIHNVQTTPRQIAFDTTAIYMYLIKLLSSLVIYIEFILNAINVVPWSDIITGIMVTLHFKLSETQLETWQLKMEVATAYRVWTMKYPSGSGVCPRIPKKCIVVKSLHARSQPCIPGYSTRYQHIMHVNGRLRSQDGGALRQMRSYSALWHTQCDYIIAVLLSYILNFWLDLEYRVIA